MSERILDLQYMDLVEDPLASVQMIYDYFQMELTFETETRLWRHIAKKPQHKHGKHHYSADALGFSEAVERDRFRDYVYEFEVVTGV